MNFASNFAFISKKKAFKAQKKEIIKVSDKKISQSDSDSEQDLNLNVFIVTFEGVKTAQKQLAGGDPYLCKECGAILNKYSKVYWEENLPSSLKKVELHKNQAFWKCEFCNCENILKIQKQEIPSRDDVVYMLEGAHNQATNNDSTLIFCIDASGSMNSTTEIQGKVDLKFGLSQQQIDMLRQFMEPGDEAQFNYFPGANQNKTHISRKQCILSAIQSQLNQICKSDPHKKIGFVVFNSQVTILGDSKNQTINIVGDKLYSKESVVNSLKNFKLMDPIIDSHHKLINSINKTQAKGQTALGPALVTALNLAAKGSPGSSVILCTDGLANIGIGQLQPYDEARKKFYVQLGQQAKQHNITVNIITIKGQGCKIQAIGKLAQLTNGNIKVVNPQKLSDDFANVLKDQVVGINVLVRVMLHKAMHFRNESIANLKDGGRILERKVANATKNTRISFEYEIKEGQQLKQKGIQLENLSKIPFQAQIQYTSTNGAKYLRVVTSECNTTDQRQKMKKEANLGVVHHRITSQTAALYQAGNYKDSTKFNNKWSNYLNENFKEKKFQQHQNKFLEKNQRLNKAIRHRHRKSIQKKQAEDLELSENQRQIIEHLSDIQSDEDQKQLVDNVMERACYSIIKRHSDSGSDESKRSGSHSLQKKQKKPAHKPERKKSLIKQAKKQKKVSVEKKQRRRSIPKRRKSIMSSGSDSN